jgi:hypothetical protein
VGVCVDDGWFKRPHLNRVRLIWLWSWVRMHTCCKFDVQVKPVITTHTQRKRSLAWQHGAPDSCSNICKMTISLDLQSQHPASFMFMYAIIHTHSHINLLFTTCRHFVLLIYSNGCIQIKNNSEQGQASASSPQTARPWLPSSHFSQGLELCLIWVISITLIAMTDYVK